jgi:hypothetical protein
VVSECSLNAGEFKRDAGLPDFRRCHITDIANFVE